jgi:hypothetical protein
MNGLDSAFKCGIEGWLQTSEEKHQWQHLVAYVVQYAFKSRSAILITVSPQKWSIGYFLPEPHHIHTNQRKYLVNKIKNCSTELLIEIAESEDFQRGLLLVLARKNIEIAQFLATATLIDVTSENPSVSNYEFLILLDDGHKIYWVYPDRDVNLLKSELQRAARNFEWLIE